MATDFQEVKRIAWKVVEEIFGIAPIAAGATGTPSASTYLRGDLSWQTPTVPLVWTTIALSGTLVKNTGYVFTANNIAGAMPSSPANGDTIYCASAVATLTGCSITRGGNNIMALAEDMALDNNRHFFFGLTYYAATTDWRLV